MKPGMDPFPMDVIQLGEKKILVRMNQAETMRGKNIVVSDELHNHMIKPHSLEAGVWKDNVARKPACRVKPTSNMLIEKYLRQQQQMGMRR
jgi:hypothetical protein